jgi:hypothetical protein
MVTISLANIVSIAPAPLGGLFFKTKAAAWGCSDLPNDFDQSLNSVKRRFLLIIDEDAVASRLLLC